MTSEEEKAITPDEWLAKEKWTKFLMSLPVGKSRIFPMIDERKLGILRVTASGITDRNFTITVEDAERKYFKVTAYANE